MVEYITSVRFHHNISFVLFWKTVLVWLFFFWLPYFYAETIKCTTAFINPFIIFDKDPLRSADKIRVFIITSRLQSFLMGTPKKCFIHLKLTNSQNRILLHITAAKGGSSQHFSFPSVAILERVVGSVSR